jgi:tetratricopeptide (TPR) repeat protein
VTSLDLNVLERADALRLLSFHADGERLLQDRVAAESEAADVLCQEVGDLPLALVLLGARLADQPDLTLADLLKDLRAKGAEATALMQAHPELGAKLGVVESLLISWEPLSVAAKELAVLLSIMAPAVIPWDLVEGCRFEDQKLIEGRAFGDGQAELRKAQLLQRVAKERYQLHPLVRLFVELQGRQPELQLAEGRWRNQFARAVAELSKENFQDVMPLNKQAEVEVYVPHIAKVARCDGYILRDDDLFWPFAILSRLCENQAAFDDALDWHERCLVLCEERLGREHPDTAACLNNLANLLRVTNRLSEAEPRMRRALAAAEANHGTNHPDVARILNNIAGLLMATNRLSEAEQHYLRALHIHESHYGPEHPETAMCLNNLAQLLYSTRRCKEAEPLMRRALAIEEARYGPEHPNVAISLNNLAGLLDVTNRPSEAESFYRHALAIDESSLGPEHPNVALRLYNLAGLLKDTNRLAEAESLILRALAIDEASYGPDHPNVARDLSSLANLLRATNRLFKAEQLYRRALEINESSFGPNHPKVASSLNNLAGLLKNVRRFKKAEPLYRRALAIDEASYGLNHPDVARDLNNLASLLRETKQLSDAEPLHRRALAINEAIYGPYHPDVATDLNNLAMLLLDANRLSEAEPLMRRVLLILLACSLHGHEHSHLQAAVSNYKNVLRSMGLSKQTIKLRLESLSAEALLSRPFDEIPPF